MLHLAFKFSYLRYNTNCQTTSWTSEVLKTSEVCPTQSQEFHYDHN